MMATQSATNVHHIEECVLVGDIGGTNARFALFNSKGDMVKMEKLQVADHATFDEALSTFLGRVDVKPSSVCFAVAGPVSNGEAKFTNAPWQIAEASLKSAFDFETAKVINDYEALSRFALHKLQDDVFSIKKGNPIADAPVLTLGPGTGLGQGFVVPHKDGPIPVPTEGGHVVLPASNDDERAVIEIVSRTLGRAPTGEDLVCGSGLVRLHEAMCERDGHMTELNTPQAITKAADEGNEEALATFNQFCAFLGTIAGSASLAVGARGGVMITGGILPRVPHILAKSPFSERFVGSGAMAHYLADIPVDLLIAGDGALRGAAWTLWDAH